MQGRGRGEKKGKITAFPSPTQEPVQPAERGKLKPWSKCRPLVQIASCRAQAGQQIPSTFPCRTRGWVFFLGCWVWLVIWEVEGEYFPRCHFLLCKHLSFTHPSEQSLRGSHHLHLHVAFPRLGTSEQGQHCCVFPSTELQHSHCSCNFSSVFQAAFPHAPSIHIFPRAAWPLLPPARSSRANWHPVGTIS